MGSRAQTGRVTAQRYEHSRYEISDTVKMAAVSTNGHTNMEGMKVKGQEEYREEDGYFTCAVSVQHKKHDIETSSAYSASDSEHARKVVWPANQAKGEKQVVDTSRTFQNTFSKSTSQADQQHKWLQNEESEKKTAFEMRQSCNRISRSASRSKNIMDRARSFERAAAESRGNSRPASRTGSIGGRHRSPSGTRGQVEEMWMNQLERPGSRTDVDSRRFGEIGRVQTAEWEERIRGSTENLPTRTPPLKRRELNLKRNPELERGFDTKTPEPPPPPTRMTYQPNTVKEPECEFPPPPESDNKSKLSEESVGQISEENKENIVKQWVESTTQSAEEIAKELEKFAYDIAETVVSNMEKNSEKKTHKTQSGGGMYFAAPAATTHRELHGPVYVQEDNRRVGMTFQQEERRREELRKQEEAKQEEKRKLELEMEAQRLQEEQQRKLEEMRQAQEEEMRRQEEARRLEMERQQMLALQKQEEERKRQAEIEEKKRQEELRRAEEEKLKQQELKRIEEEKKRQEILRFEKLKQEEELKRQEEMRLEQEMRRQDEMQQQLEIQRKKEQQLLLEQQRMEIERQREQQLLLEQQRINQDNIGVRDHIPKISKTKSFEASQDRQNESKTEDHLSLIKTGQVNEKRNFWMRSTSADRLNQVSLSPAPRRRRIDWNAKQKENDDPESRPGSSLGQANTGSVRNLSSGFIAKSKSSAAVMQDEVERGRPKQKTVIANGWTKEQYDQKVKQEFLKSQEVKTNKVTDTVQTWGKRDGSQTGRTTPAPSRNIGEGFSENKVGKTSEVDKNANSWRTKTPEPTVKLVYVSVEKAMGSNQNIHISENAHKQMANFMSSSTIQQEVTNTVMTNTMSSQSSVTSHSTSRCSADMNCQPPPTPERNQSYGVAVRYLNQ